MRKEIESSKTPEELAHERYLLKWAVIGGLGAGIIALGFYLGWALLVNPSMPHCLTWYSPPVCKP